MTTIKACIANFLEVVLKSKNKQTYMNMADLGNTFQYMWLQAWQWW